MNYYAPDDYALVIGINDYPNWNKGEKSLRGPIRDAIGFHKWLTDPLGGGVPPANAHLITSVTKPLAPLQSGIDDFFGQIRELSEGKDRRRFYFYFSGHGHSPAGSFQRQCLCLPNWSPQLAGAALDVDSYVKAAIGCLKFSEALFFLDCCRVRQVAPLGKPSDLECGDPQVENRNYAIVFASDHYKPGLEGVVDGEVQGYFTAAMLRILDKETIELNDLVTRLKVDVPALARPRDQTVRSLPTDKKIYLGPPDRKPPTAEPIPQVYEDRTIARLAPTPEGGERVVASVIRMLVDETHNLTVNVRSALRRLSSSEELEAPAPGEIIILRGTTIRGRTNGSFEGPLPAGDYQIHIAHGEATATHSLRLTEDTVVTFDLPKRDSAVPLSDTLAENEAPVSPAIEASRWAPAELEPARRQAIFVNVRPARGDMEFDGQLLAVARESIRELSVGNALIPVMDDEPVTLTYHDPDGSFVFLPLPIVAGWDTQVFIVLGDDGKPSLSTASVSMREAGTGFDPSDGLIDAYERAIADLATDGPSPDGRTMNALLSGRFRNPLYCLVGAHFQVRKISRSRMRSKEEFDVLDMAIENLARLFGPNSPDVIALRLRRKQLSKADRNSVGQEFVAIAPRPPLLAVSFEAFVEATTGAEGGLAGISAIAVGLEPNSPWTCWRWRQSGLRLSSGIADPEGNTVTLSLTEPRLAAEIEEFWRTLGYAVTNKDEETGSVLSLRGERSEIVDGVAEQTLSLLTVPEWLVEYVREIIDQSARTGVPVDMATLVRRTGMPANLLSAAHFLMRLRSGEHREPLYNSFSAT